MKALLLIAHGSRREASNDEVRMLAREIATIKASGFDFIVPAFLELADPDIVSGVDRCVEMGATEVVVIPYFLSAGRHVVEDIPAELDKARSRHPSVMLDVRPHLGSVPMMATMVLDSATPQPEHSTSNH